MASPSLDRILLARVQSHINAGDAGVFKIAAAGTAAPSVRVDSVTIAEVLRAKYAEYQRKYVQH